MLCASKYLSYSYELLSLSHMIYTPVTAKGQESRGITVTTRPDILDGCCHVSYYSYLFLVLNVPVLLLVVGATCGRLTYRWNNVDVMLYLKHTDGRSIFCSEGPVPWLVMIVDLLVVVVLLLLLLFLLLLLALLLLLLLLVVLLLLVLGIMPGPELTFFLSL